MSIRTVASRLTVLSVLVVVTMLAFVAGAWAAPAAPTLTVDELQTLLDDNGGQVDGYFKTVLKGKTVVDIDATVLSITGGSQVGPTSGAALIYFETDDPRITENGGVASGMSGSPLYVDDNGTDKLVGAVSYGNWFTRKAALATPIESMIPIESMPGLATTSVSQLDRMVLTDAGVVDKVLVTMDPEKHAAKAVSGTIVATPLSAVSIGGINPNTKIFKKYAEFLNKRGLSVVRGPETGMSSMTHSIDEPLTEGGSVAALAARGDLWVGGMGTVTYTNADNAIAFGHPLYWTGATGLLMTNAWVDGVFPTEETPYKLMRPGALRGTLTQDRKAGIMGVDGQMPTEIPVVSKARFGAESAETTVLVPAMAMNSSSWDFYGLPALGTWVAGARLFDSLDVPGSVMTTTTVVVKDGSQSWTVVRKNRFNSTGDVTYDSVTDVDSIVTRLQMLSANGIAKPKIQSVKLESSFSATPNLMEVVDVTVAGGLKHGANKATVTYKKWGQVAKSKMDVWFIIPSNVPVSGTLTAFGTTGDDDLFDDFDALDEETVGGGWIDSTTTKEAVDELRKELTNDKLTVSFQPIDLSWVGGEEGEDEEPVDFDPIEASVRTNSVVVGSVSKSAPAIVTVMDPAGTLPYFEYPGITGMIVGTEGGGTLKISRRYVRQSAWAPQGTAKFESGTVFEALLDPMSRNATLRLMYSGDDSSLAATQDVNVKVAAKVKLKPSAKTIKRGKKVTLTATVLPKDSGGKVVFERYSGGRWKAIATRYTVGGKAAYKYKAPLGSNRLRARTIGSAVNAPGTSSKITVKVVK